MSTPPSKEDVIEELAQHLASVTDHTIEESRNVAAAIVNGELSTESQDERTGAG